MDYADAAIAALVTALEAAVTAIGSPVAGNVDVTDAWPDFQGMTPGDRAYVVVSMGEPSAEPLSPVLHDFEDGIALYRTHDWTAAVQVTVFAWYKDTASALAAALAPYLSQVPFDAGITLTSTDYHDDRVRFLVDGGAAWSPAAALQGVWMRALTITAKGHIIAPKATPALLRLDGEINDRAVAFTS